MSHILSQANHKLNHVQPWAEKRLDTVQSCVGEPVRALDWSDDRLACILDKLSDDRRWAGFETALGQHLIRVYEVRPERVRLDSTTASRYTQVSPDGLFQVGHSKDHRPDLPQLKVQLSALDPLGLPISSTIVSGERADDPVRRIGGRKLSATNVVGTDGKFHAYSAYPTPQKRRATIACGEGHVGESHQFFGWSMQDVYGERYTA